MKSQETREWIERMIDEGEDIYVVIIYHRLVNTRILRKLEGLILCKCTSTETPPPDISLDA